MWKEKENYPEEFSGEIHLSFKSSTKGKASGKDYVLKRYHLEQNKLFKRPIEQLHYLGKMQAYKENDQESEKDQEVIIIEDDKIPQSQERAFKSKNIHSNNVYVFDQQVEEVKLPARQKVQAKVACPDDSQFNIKSSAQDDFSRAELLSPKFKKFSKNKQQGKDSNDIMEKLCKKITEKSLEEHLPRNQNRNNIPFKKEFDQQDDEIIERVKIVPKKRFQEDLTFNIVDKRLFSLSHLSPGRILKCLIKRTSNFTNFMSPQFDLYLANGLKHVLSAKKYPLKNRELFKFSVNPSKFNDDNIFAALHANSQHNNYWLVDFPSFIQSQGLSFIYLILGYDKFKKSFKERRFTVLLPSASKRNRLSIDYEQKRINFLHFREQIKRKFQNMQNWLEKQTNSAKNFVLADDDDPDYRYLELRKQSDNIFQLSIQHPLNPLQAMAIAMTRFDAQLN